MDASPRPTHGAAQRFGTSAAFSRSSRRALPSLDASLPREGVLHVRGESRGACGLFVGFSDDRRFFVPVLVLFVFRRPRHRRDLAAASCYPCSIAAAVACPWIFSRSASSSATRSEMLCKCGCPIRLDGWDARRDRG